MTSSRNSEDKNAAGSPKTQGYVGHLNEDLGAHRLKTVAQYDAFLDVCSASPGSGSSGM